MNVLLNVDLINTWPAAAFLIELPVLLSIDVIIAVMFKIPSLEHFWNALLELLL